MKRSRLSYPGGWVAVSTLVTPIHLDPCVWCFAEVGTTLQATGWMHVPSGRVVCTGCLPDPWKDGGKAGERMAERVVEVKDEWEAQVW